MKGREGERWTEGREMDREREGREMDGGGERWTEKGREWMVPNCTVA